MHVRVVYVQYEEKRDRKRVTSRAQVYGSVSPLGYRPNIYIDTRVSMEYMATQHFVLIHEAPRELNEVLL